MIRERNVVVVMSENQEILPEQQIILEDNFKEYKILKFKERGLGLGEMYDLTRRLEETRSVVVFLTTIPLLLTRLSTSDAVQVYVSHKFDEVEESDRIISREDLDGWSLVKL